MSVTAGRWLLGVAFLVGGLGFPLKTSEVLSDRNTGQKSFDY
jgi:hypothetical protein